MSSPSEISEKWSRRLAGATSDIKKGVESVTVAPSEEAIRKKEKFKAELMKAIEEGRWEEALKEYTLEAWKRDMINKGINRIPQGAENAKKDFEAFLTEFLPFVERVKNEAEKMPDLTLEDRIRRAEYVIRELAKFRRK